MQKHLGILALTVGVSLVAALSGNAQTISYDGFNYPDGGIATQSGGDSFGWAYAWASSTAGSKIGTNTSVGLTYGDLMTDGGALQVGTPQVASGTGTAGGTTASPQRTLTDTLGNLAAANGGTLWMSFLFYNPTYPTTLYYRQSNVGFFSGSTSGLANGSEKADLGLPNGSATVGTTFAAWGGTVSGSAPNVSSVSAFSPNVQFVLIELSVDNTTANDTYYAWFNLDPSLFANNANSPSIATADVSNSGADLSSVNAIRFQAGNANANGTNAFFTVDEFRMGDTFADVTPIPEPVATAFAALGGLALLALKRRRQ